MTGLLLDPAESLMDIDIHGHHFDWARATANIREVHTTLDSMLRDANEMMAYRGILFDPNATMAGYSTPIAIMNTMHLARYAAYIFLT
jgi:hypothetical protein